MPPHIETFSVKDWLEKSIILVQQTAKTHHIDIKLNYTDDDVFEADQAQLQQVIINLLINSIQASENNAEININVKFDDEQVEVTIQDHGCGIKEESINNIYDPFYTTKAEGEGSGLGLSISLGIIESHQGTLSIMNNKNTSGTTAILILPVHNIKVTE